LEHPAPAVISGEPVTEAQVKETQKNWETQREKCEKLSQEMKEAATRFEERTSQLQDEEKEIPKDLEERQEAVKSKIFLTETLIRTEKAREDKKWKRDEAKENYAHDLDAWEAARIEAGFSDEASYRESLSLWKTKREAEGKKREAEEYFRRLYGKQDTVEELEKQAKGKEYTNLSELEEQIRGLKAEKESLQAAREEAMGLLRNHEGILKSLETEQKEYERLLEQFLLYDGLSQAAGGKLKGQVRMDFETYVQRMYFEKILAAANKRFLTFTDGRMKLKSRSVEDMDLTGPAGLELNVYVMATGKERDVKTLSGGESFLASLSLALGFSDVVQSQAGAVRLESMFVDEGFGALDDRTRDQAIRVLNELARDDRMIGIISHVGDLKESIERKLVVTRGLQGSTVKWME